tara:strand:- start:12147 stop:13034 length:888 start_codon:yes stop_codon:yes gene_type:complete
MKILTRYKTNWDEFVVKDENWDTDININDITASDRIILVTLNMSRYRGYAGTGYEVGTATRGVTEQEAYNIWIGDFQLKQRTLLKQLKSFGLLSIPQCVFDGLLLYFIINGNVLTVTAPEEHYEIRDYIVAKDWNTVASMIKRSNFNREFCARAATIIRLSDYGKTKTRSWMRQNGIYNMRERNELGALAGDMLTRARFAYFAETTKFLANTPEGVKRTIVNEYEKTVIVEQFTYSSASVFTISASPSMDPVEKLTVELNGTAIQHYFDFTLTNNVITIIKTLNVGDIVRFTTKI